MSTVNEHGTVKAPSNVFGWTLPASPAVPSTLVIAAIVWAVGYPLLSLLTMPAWWYELPLGLRFVGSAAMVFGLAMAVSR